MNPRKPLYDRDNACSRDVQDALGNLVRKHGPDSLPLPLTCAQVVEELLVIDQTDDDGTFVPHRQGVLRQRRATFTADLHYAADVFRFGYRMFKESTGMPVVPVSNWFFDNVFTDDLRGCLDAMLAAEVEQSMPRAGYPTAGVVIFPRQSNHALVGLSLDHLMRSTDGMNRAALGSIDRCALGLTQAAIDYEHAMAKAGLLTPDPLALTGGLRDDE